MDVQGGCQYTWVPTRRRSCRRSANSAADLKATPSAAGPPGRRDTDTGYFLVSGAHLEVLPLAGFGCVGSVSLWTWGFSDVLLGVWRGLLEIMCGLVGSFGVSGVALTT